MQDAFERSWRYVKAHHVMNLFTNNHQESWGANLFYAAHPGNPHMYVMTSRESVHGRLMKNNPQVCGTITCEAEDVAQLKGVQFRGMIEPVDPTHSAAYDTYYTRFPYAKARPDTLWQINLSKIKFTDNEQGFGRKFIWENNNQEMRKKQRIIIGISGATGIDYGMKAIQLLKHTALETHLIVSKGASLVRSLETDYTYQDLTALADVTYAPADMGAAVSSGSFKTVGMLIAPCSVKTMSEIATGVTSSLLSRAADVVLKERRKLVLMFRETPLHAGHIQTMATVTSMGGVIMPPVPAFYMKPSSIDEMVAHSVSRALDLFGLDLEIPRWKEMQAYPDTPAKAVTE